MNRSACLLLLWPVIGAADPIDIRSGEHDTFSRLVLSIPENTEWNVFEGDGGYVLQFEGHNDGFQTSEIFERIPRDRIADIEVNEPDMLSLNVTCDCHVDAFLWRPNRLVVDIVDGPLPESLIAVDALPTQEDPPSQTLPDLLSLERTAPLDVVPLDMEAAPSSSPAADFDLAATETALVEGLARAASQGFLQAATEPSIAEPATVDLSIPAEVTVEPTIPVTVSPHPGIGISTSLDRDLALLGAALDRSTEQLCLPEDFFALRDWADETAFHSQAAVLIADLAGEFGQVPPDAQENLARFYVSFGFGAEARIVLSSDRTSSQSRQVLVELANIVDEMDGEHPLVSAQIECQSPASLWAFLVAPQSLDEEQTDLVQQNFFDLPHPLRGHIAPRLARAFVEAGDPDGAERILRATESRDVESTHETQSARALVADEAGRPDRARDLLAQEIDDNARATPASVIRLIELAIEQGELPREADLLLAAALGQEHRDAPIAADLAIAQSKGHAVLGQYRAALALVEQREDDEALAAQDFAFSQLASNADVTTFLELSYSTIPGGLTSTTENMVSRRLIDLGFAERTVAFLRGPAEREAAAERRYLRAEAAVYLADYATAIEALQGITDDRARVLRAKAHSGMGDHRDALSALDGTANPEDQATLQFRAQAWERLNLQDDEVWSSFAASVLDVPNDDPVSTLSDRRDILAESAQSRLAVENLLLRFDGATPPDG